MKKSIVMLALLACLLQSAAPASDDLTGTSDIQYQGKLTSSTGLPVPDGSYNVRFALYTAATGGYPYGWAGSESVQTHGGLFMTRLASIPNNLLK